MPTAVKKTVPTSAEAPEASSQRANDLQARSAIIDYIVDQALDDSSELLRSDNPSINENCCPASTFPPVVVPTSKARIFRNLFFLSCADFCLFSAFTSLSNLQSTMNAKDGIGPDSQAVIYLCSMVSCFIPELLIDKFGCKSTFVLSLLLSFPFVASNFHLRWDVVMATSILYGISSGPLNTAASLYLDEMSVRYKSLSRESGESVRALVFGFYMIFTEATQILGNGLTFVILERGKHPVPVNISIAEDCGIHFRPSLNLNNTNLDPPSDHDRIVLTGAFVALSLLAVVVALFLDPLKNDVKVVRGCSAIGLRMVSAVKQLKNPNQLLLLLLTVYCGMEEVFFMNEFTQAFIACSWGVHHVGFVTICFGVCGALMSILVGPLVKLISQMSVILLAALINLITCGLLFFWQPSPDEPAFYFIFAGLFGITDAIWWSQIPALYGLMFPNNREAAFSNFFFWAFFGYFISYSYANYLTVAVKLSIMLVFLVAGIVLYVVGQVKLKCASTSGYTSVVEGE